VRHQRVPPGGWHRAKRSWHFPLLFAKSFPILLADAIILHALRCRSLRRRLPQKGRRHGTGCAGTKPAFWPE
jgi:hypothetical protein